MQLQRLPGSYPYPDTIPDIRIFRISRGEAQGSYAQLRLRAASEVTSQFDFETYFSCMDFSADCTILTAMISRVQSYEKLLKFFSRGFA